MLVDEATITISGGKGGDGALSFRREKFIPKGGPDGGNGGNGGNVYFLGIEDISALRQFRFKKSLEAESGGSGAGNKKHGKNGPDLIIKIPHGTLITDLDIGTSFEIARDQKVLIAKGGIGGFGNWEFRTATNRTPQNFERGTPGELKNLKLDLQLIADIGLVGMPNVGKSSILNELTNAGVKTANYPFTTLEPNLGDMGGIIIADIPGLIENAHQGKGLGFRFLKHVGKTKLLVFCIAADSVDPMKEYRVVLKEIETYNKELLNKPSLIILTKHDLVDAKMLAKLSKVFKKYFPVVLPVSIYDLDSIKKVRKVFQQSVKHTIS